MKKTMIAAMLLAFMGATVHAWAMRVAYVDVAKVFDRYQGTQDAKAKLKKQANREKTKLEAEQDSLKKKLSDLEAQKGVLTKAKYDQKQAKIMSDIKDLQNQIQTVQQSLSDQEQQMTSQILDEIKEVVRRVADKEKWDYVFEKNAVLVGGEDITATVIRQLNQGK